MTPTQKPVLPEEKISELRIKIKHIYSQLDKKFKVWKKPTKEMRELQQEVWAMKKQLKLLTSQGAVQEQEGNI